MARAPRAWRRAALALMAAALLSLSSVGCSALVPNWWIGGWSLQTYGGRPAALPATLSFSASDVVIQTGCNQGAGSYTFADPKLTLKGVAFTERACADPAVAAQDAAFLALTRGPVTMHADEKQLTLDPGDGGPVLVFTRTSGA